MAFHPFVCKAIILALTRCGDLLLVLGLPRRFVLPFLDLDIPDNTDISAQTSPLPRIFGNPNPFCVSSRRQLITTERNYKRLHKLLRACSILFLKCNSVPLSLLCGHSILYPLSLRTFLRLFHRCAEVTTITNGTGGMITVLRHHGDANGIPMKTIAKNTGAKMNTQKT